MDSLAIVEGNVAEELLHHEIKQEIKDEVTHR